MSNNISYGHQSATATNSVDSVSTSKFKRGFARRLILILIGGMFLDGYVLGIVGPVSGPMSADLGISSFMSGLIAAAALFGTMIGTPLGGWAADKFGRKPMFMIDVALFTIASVMQFFIHEPGLLILVRFLMGLAIGMEYAVGWPMLSEFAPARLRGRLMGATQVAWYSGFMMAWITGYILNEYTDLAWTFILGTSTFLAVALMLARIGTPESPRWLWQKGRHEEANAIIDKYLHRADFNDLDQEIEASGKFSMLFSKDYWRTTVFIAVGWIAAVTPYFAIATFADTLMSKWGFDSGLTGGVGLSVVATIGTLFILALADKVNRRTLAIPTQWIACIALAVIGLWSGAPSWLVLALFLLFSVINPVYMSMNTIYAAEVFPTAIRGIGIGFTGAMSRIVAGFGTFLLPPALEYLGTSAAMLGAAAVTLLGVIVTQYWAPETRGLTLTDASAPITGRYRKHAH